jgi:hypothetical protein
MTYNLSGKIVKYNQRDEELDFVEGSWTESVKIGGKTYWDMHYNNYIKPRPDLNVLPSDCRFREDSYYMYKGNIAKA